MSMGHIQIVSLHLPTPWPFLFLFKRRNLRKKLCRLLSSFLIVFLELMFTYMLSHIKWKTLFHLLIREKKGKYPLSHAQELK